MKADTNLDPLPAGRESRRADDPHWYKDAVIYELHVKAFADANGDGIGDLRGLTEHLDHVQSLGVDTIWLLPFYPSPLRDDGYDVADYRDVHPSYGTLDDFRAFVAEAHRRGLRVLIELIVNHTSDQHPWFQAARRAPRGSPERDFYVWSDDPARYAGTRIIFTDTEKSNWTWDEVAGQYYWHRFFSHQPDLNFDNPAVLDAILDIMEYWLKIGVDGFRLDAIPYLVERDGTSNENLRETHAVIKRIRARVDAQYPGRLLLAEANMWPEDVREYFGDDDECQMAYHFPLMPRMYMAIAQEDRHPIVEILQQTPAIPPNCQWAIFLRNHDELTLEMVTSRERDYLYRTYAAEPRARLNLGIRRRLAPLLENDRARIELMNSLLLSMPGTPVLYYGDEIGMGDNIYIGDRDGVRTPMQWTSDRNGGFSRADPQRLYLPPIQDPIYGYEVVNVEAQSREPSSLLNWMRRLLSVRATSTAFGRGSFVILHPGNRKVLAYVREHGAEVVLCVANVSRSAQPVELELRAYKGRVPVEMLGRTAFPPIGDLPYLLTLPGHGFFWFRLATDVAPPSWHDEVLPAADLPVLVLFDRWSSLFPDQVVPWRIGLAERLRAQFEQDLLPHFVARQRWYATKSVAISRVELVDHAVLADGGEDWLVALADVHGADGPTRYFLPLSVAWEDHDDERLRGLSGAAVCKVRQQAAVGLLGDAMADNAFCHVLLSAIDARRSLASARGTLRFTRGPAFDGLGHDPAGPAAPVRRRTTSSNSVSLIGEQVFLKAYRRLRPGAHPEIEMGRYLHDVAGFRRCVPVAGSLEHVAPDGTPTTLAMVQPQVTHQGDAWSYTLELLTRMLESWSPGTDAPAEGAVTLERRVRVIAEAVAELHVALARPTDDPAFAPEPTRPQDVADWLATIEAECTATLQTLRRERPQLGPVASRGADRLFALEPALRARLRALSDQARPVGQRTRLHGDLHLGQVLICREDVVLTDFEGEPQRPFDERRRKHSALRDVAGMMRSFDYARHATLDGLARAGIDVTRLEPVAHDWAAATRDRFVAAYREAAVAGGLYADAARFAEAMPLLELFELDKALYELRYELDNRPDWIAVPLSGLAAWAERTQPAPG